MSDKTIYITYINFIHNVRYAKSSSKMYIFHHVDPTYNAYDYQPQPAITDFSPRAGNRRNTQNKLQQVRDKINDVISLANTDQREGKN